MPKDVFGKGHQFLSNSALLSYDQLERLIRIFAEHGVTKIRLTGGEPLLRNNLEELVGKIASIPAIEDIALTTNASLLSRKRASALKSAGVRRINISLDALTPEIYQKINEISVSLETILDGVNNAIAAGFETVKVNMVVQKGINVSDILPMVEYFRCTGATLRFIEFMDVGNHNQWNRDKVFQSAQIIDLINRRFPLESLDANYPYEVAQRWRYLDGAGEIGVISSISQPFCGDCARARLSAKGELFTCLFAHQGVDLKKLLEDGVTDVELSQTLARIWSRRDDQYSAQREISQFPLSRTSRKVEMSYIGG